MIQIELTSETMWEIEELHWKYFKNTRIKTLKKIVDNSSGKNNSTLTS